MMKPITCMLLLSLLMFPMFVFGSDTEYEKQLMKLKAKFESINDYSCIFEGYSSNMDKSANVTFKYYFKKPKSVRMEILEGSHSGTILLYKGTKVRVKPGMFVLGWFSFDYPPEHKYVCDYRGNGVHNSDWGYFISEHIKLLELTTGRLTGEQTLDRRKVMVYELISKDPSRSRSIAREQLWIDKEQDLLIKYEQYDSSGKLIQSGYYRDITINRGINNSVFTNFKSE